MGQKAYFFFGPPVSFKDFCVTIGVGSSGYSGMEHFGILKLDLFGSVSFLIRFLNMWNQTKRISKINILPDPPPKNARTSTPKCPKLRRCMKYFEKNIFSHFLGAAASHIAQEKRFVVRIARTVPDVQWLLCCSFGIDTTRWLNHLYFWKYSWKPRESSQSFGKRKDILTPPSMREHWS